MATLTTTESSEEINPDSISETVDRLKNSAISENTLRAYYSDWKRFCQFCGGIRKPALPAESETITAYIAWLVSLRKRYSTIRRHLTSIGRIHELKHAKNPVKDPQVEIVLSGAARETGAAPRAATPITWPLLTRLVDNCPPSVIGIRNAALFLIGWSAALRRSEIASMKWEDITFSDLGVTIHLPRSKTDPTGLGYDLAIPYSGHKKYCPVVRLKQWQERIRRYTGVVFTRLGKGGEAFYFYSDVLGKKLSDKSISNIIKQGIYEIGEDPRKYSGHSLRRGFATECGRMGIPERLIQRQTRHLSISVLRSYIDAGNIWDENPLRAVWHEIGRVIRQPGAESIPAVPLPITETPLHQD
jgi:integrase